MSSPTVPISYHSHARDADADAAPLPGRITEAESSFQHSERSHSCSSHHPTHNSSPTCSGLAPPFVLLRARKVVRSQE